MRGDDVLAILPTGAGKSLCYQMPALSRYDKTGALTVVISPLVALMADQVTGLEKRGITSCVTVNGLLSMLERAEALDRVRLGGAAIMLISPEQLRSVAVRSALRQREIGAWVLDEAHCLSKWGHDFRPDYRYVGRFIRERAGRERVPPVLCLTATAKPDVKEEIVAYFRQSPRHRDEGVRRRQQPHEPGIRRGQAPAASMKLPRHPRDRWPSICRRTQKAERSSTARRAATPKRSPSSSKSEALTLIASTRDCRPRQKKNIQQSFIEGNLRVIAATNAFGMGIDKPDVRLVVHADIPSSLENYLQEAGRAGRDQQQAHCVLLYTLDDVERQFGMSARSRLTRREIHGVLRALRSLNRLQRAQQRRGRGQPRRDPQRGRRQGLQTRLGHRRHTRADSSVLARGGATADPRGEQGADLPVVAAGRIPQRGEAQTRRQAHRTTTTAAR